MPVRAKHKGDFKNTERFFRKMTTGEIFSALSGLGQLGVDALSAATPEDTGLAASSWSFSVEISRSSSPISWNNDNVENGFPVAIMIQYGHGTGTGGYVQGRDYINPAMSPVFDKIAEQMWKVVVNA